jgi:two-component system CheB/CheR fusion protein
MTSALRPDGGEQELSDQIEDIVLVPSHGGRKVPVVGLGGSAGSIEALQQFFGAMPLQSGLAFVVMVHLPADHDLLLTEVIHRRTRMKVVEVPQTLVLDANTVFVVPPGKVLQLQDGELCLADLPEGRARHLIVDVLFRTLAVSHGVHAAAVVLSGLDGDGAIGIRRIKERGGLTVAQDPEQAAHGSMPRRAIDTGMVDWVLPVQDMPARLLAYFRRENAVALPPEDGPAEAARREDAQSISDLANHEPEPR